MNSYPILFLSDEKGKVIIKPSCKKYEDDINSTNSLNILLKTDYKNLKENKIYLL